MIVGYFFRADEACAVEFWSMDVALTTKRRMRRHGWDVCLVSVDLDPSL